MSTSGNPNSWEYIPVLDECIKILLTIGIGIMMGNFHVLDTKTFLPQATKFVFHIALPLHIFKGIGIGTDFYDDSFLWKFICVFLVLRVIALLFSFIVATKKGGIGQVAVMWLALTWISTVIMGVPIAAAVFGDPNKGRTYGILAGISSFIFQLPLQLVLFECHVLEKNYLVEQEKKRHDESAMAVINENHEQVLIPPMCAVSEPKEDPEQALVDVQLEIASRTKSDLAVEAQGVPLTLWKEWICSWSVWKKILSQLLRNPVVWGILAGFIFSLSTIGPRFLDPTSEDYVAGLGWIFATAGWLGDCVSPVALVAMGVWMSAQGRTLLRIPLMSALLFMMSKLVIVPLITLGLAKAVGLNNEAGRAAVLIAALPISMASFSLADRYEIGEAVLSENVALGTALILPTILLWNLVMDALDIFPIAQL